MNIEQLSYLQRETLKGLHALGGSAKRSDIANAAKIDGLKVPAALTRLESYGFVDKGEDQRWRVSASGKLILQNAGVEESCHAAEPVVPSPAPVPVPEPKPVPAPEPQSMREKMAGELKARTRPPFDPADAAWLCRALSEEHRDMPAISGLLRQMSEYFG